MSAVNFGTAHLFVEKMPEHKARALLEAAIAAGAARLDTAPLYGYGRSEVLVAAVAAMSSGIAVTTKVGLEPASEPSAMRHAAGALMRRLPPALFASLRTALRRGDAPSQSAGPSGRFESRAVKASLERSLARLGRLDRLLLHEVHPADITDELLALLVGYRRRGDVGTLGIATGNAVTIEALERGDGIFGVAHVSIDPLGAPHVPAKAMPSVLFVGHGALGPGGRTLRTLLQQLKADGDFAREWASAASGTRYEGADGPAHALIARASATFAGEILVATARLDRVARTVAAAAGREELPVRLAALLEQALLPHPGPSAATSQAIALDIGRQP